MRQREKQRVRNQCAENLEEKKLAKMIEKEETEVSGCPGKSSEENQRRHFTLRVVNNLSYRNTRKKEIEKRQLGIIKIGSGSGRFSVFHFYFLSKAFT